MKSPLDDYNEAKEEAKRKQVLASARIDELGMLIIPIENNCDILEIYIDSNNIYINRKQAEVLIIELKRIFGLNEPDW